MDVHVITDANKAAYAAELDQLFRIRHRIYVEERKWREPSDDGRETDQFDTEHAVHLVGIRNGKIIAGSRFIPTTQPHLLSEVFPHLCTRNGVVRDSAVFEWTRGFIVPEYRETGGLLIKAQFCAAVMEYCLDEGINQIGGIQELYWLPLWKRFGWVVHVIGEPSEIDGDICVPAYFDVSEDALNGVRQCAKLNHSILVHRGSQKFPRAIASRPRPWISRSLMAVRWRRSLFGPFRRSVATGDPVGETTFEVPFLRALEIVKLGLATQLRGANAGRACGALGAIPWKQRL